MKQILEQDKEEMSGVHIGSHFVSDGRNSKPLYDGDVEEPITPIKSTGFETLNFADPAELFLFFNADFSHPDSKLRLWKWQTECLEMMARTKPNSLKPLKLALRASNGSGKDSIIIASFVVWFITSKIQSRVIITSSSGTQLTAQTENAIRNLCQSINNFFGCEYIRIRQRYISCRLSGSEIRLFATDEAGKAEGYHPLKPDAEMAIVVSEWKSVTDEIYQALRRCTGYNYWLGVSTPGEPKGSFYNACSKWNLIGLEKLDTISTPNNYTCVVTSYDCPHISKDDIEEDKIELGEHSAFFRSKHLALFTSIGGSVVIPSELIDECFNNPPKFVISDWPVRIGIDLAAGGDEVVMMFVKGNRCIKEIAWRESDTTITADRIELELSSMKIDKKHKYIWADDGGVGHSMIDMLVRKGWSINRLLNQWAAINKKNFGNRGAENWYRIKRVFEENLFDVRSVSDKCRSQLGTRKYKQQLTGARVFLMSKKEMKLQGDASPDRADALILAHCGLNIDDYIKAKTVNLTKDNDNVPEGEEVLVTDEQVNNFFDDKVKYGNFKFKSRSIGKRVFNSLRNATRL